MAQDPRTVVRGSSMLWGAQVGIVDASEALDFVGPGDAGLELLREKLQPVIYPFNRNGRVGFRALKDPYA